MSAAQLLVDVLALGAAYSLVALGFVLVLNATGAANFSQGDCVMVGGFAAATLGQRLAVPGIVLLPLVLVALAALGALFALVAYLPLRRRPPEAVFISTIAVGVILENGAALLFGPEARAAPPLLGAGQVRIGAVALDAQALATIAVAVLLIGATYGLFAYTQLGRRLRAAAQDPEIAAALGVRVDAMAIGTFAVGTALAGAAGLLLANSFFVSPTDGANYVVKAYVATVLGGWGSVPGAVAGALLIAAFEVAWPSLPLVAPALGRMPALFSHTASAMALDIAVLAILLGRPQGLFGEAMRRRS